MHTICSFCVLINTEVVRDDNISSLNYTHMLAVIEISTNSVAEASVLAC
jgi:hypothetical protein